MRNNTENIYISQWACFPCRDQLEERIGNEPEGDALGNTHGQGHDDDAQEGWNGLGQVLQSIRVTLFIIIYPTMMRGGAMIG